jgi:hypothetical protein
VDAISALSGCLDRDLDRYSGNLCHRLAATSSARRDCARTSSDPRELKTLSDDVNLIGIEIATVAYERGSTFEEFAPVQLAFESACRAVESMRSPSKA